MDGVTVSGNDDNNLREQLRRAEERETSLREEIARLEKQRLRQNATHPWIAGCVLAFLVLGFGGYFIASRAASAKHYLAAVKASQLHDQKLDPERALTRECFEDSAKVESELHVCTTELARLKGLPAPPPLRNGQPPCNCQPGDPLCSCL